MPLIPSGVPSFILPARRTIQLIIFLGIVLVSLCNCISAIGGEDGKNGYAPDGIDSSSGEFALNTSGADPVPVIIIVSPGCTKCAAAERTLEKVGQKVPLNITGLYYYTDEGHRIINQYNARDIPAIIIGIEVIDYRDYGGDASVLEDKVLRALNNLSRNSEIAPSITLPGNTSSTQGREDALAGYDLQDLSLSTALAVTAGGFVAGFNPCLFGILVFLAASILTVSGKRRELMMMVVFFSFGIFTMYFLFGLGMQRLLHSEAIAASFRYALTVLLIAAGFSQVIDAIQLKQGKASLFRTDWALQYFQARVERGRLSSYFLAGALFSLVKAPCVGGLYLAILDLISAKSYYVGAAYLMFFNLGVILPIIVVGGFLALGMSPEKVDRFRKDHRVGMRLFTGLMLLALAPLIYWQII
jgi:cytochrome c biogenesis protein CcdA/thiol-disulfide isomerase/thioredoxin